MNGPNDVDDVMEFISIILQQDIIKSAFMKCLHSLRACLFFW